MNTKYLFRFMSTMVILLHATSLFAVGAVKGVVRDAKTNEPVAGATVIVKPDSGAEPTTLMTDEAGAFTAPNLAEGNYNVTAVFPGSTNTPKALVVGKDKVAELQLMLQMGAASVEQYNVIATGTLLGATLRDSAIPLFSADRESLQKRGDPSMLDQVKSMPIIGRVFGDNNSFNPDSQFRPGSGTINLRGLGPQRTLVLLNGQRFSANNITAPDTNLIPASALGRVEILKDGGAATYGSDAIAGVVNFMTRQDVNGLELSADYKQIMGSSGDASFNGVFGRLWNGGNLLLSAAYQYRGQLNTTERSWALQPYTVNPTGFSPYQNPGLWVILGNVAGVPTPVGGGLDADCASLGGQVAFSGNNPLCWARYTPTYNLVDTTHRLQFYGELNTKLTSFMKLHLDGLYSMTYMPNISISPGFPLINGPQGPGTRFFVPAYHPQFANSLLDPTNPLIRQPPVGVPIIGAAAGIWRGPSLGGGAFGGNTADQKNAEIRLAGDISGDLGVLGMHYKLAGSYVNEMQVGGFPDILAQRLQQALLGLGGPDCQTPTPGQNGCLFLNPFSNSVAQNPFTGAANPGFDPNAVNDPVLVDWITDSDRHVTWTNHLSVLDAVVDGKIPFKLPGGEPTWAIGGHFRKTIATVAVPNPLANMNETPCTNVGQTNCAVQTGPYVFSSGFTPSRTDLGVYALYGQLDIPTFDSWKTTFGLRWEDYSGLVGGSISPQLRSKWQVFDFLALRGSIGTSFRGPTASDVSPGTYITQLQQIPVTGNLFRANDRVGNPNVLPEKALTLNVGSVWNFFDNSLTATIDYWYYKIDNQIVFIPADLIASAVTGPGAGTQLVDCNNPLLDRITFGNGVNCTSGPAPTAADIALIRSDTTNGPSLSTMGLDMELDYSIKNVFGGTLGLGGFASVTINYQQDAWVVDGVTISNAYDAVGYTNTNRLPGTLPRWRGQFFANYNIGFGKVLNNLRVGVNYIDGATDNRGPIAVQTGPRGANLSPTTACTVANATAGTAPNCVITNYGLTLPGFVSLDATYMVSLPWDMTVTVSAQNLIGMDPPATREPFGYDPFIGSPLGRTFKFAVTQKF